MHITNSQSGNTLVKIAIPIAALFVVALLLFTFLPIQDNSLDLSNLTKKVEQIESKVDQGTLSTSEKETLNELSTTLDSIESKYNNLPDNTKQDIEDLRNRIATLGNGGTTTTNDTTIVSNTDASNLNAGTVSDSLLSNNVTLQGNTFNTNSKLVQLDSSGLLPALDGSNLTNINSDTLQGNSASYYTNATNMTSGTLADARLSSNVPLLDSSNTFTDTMTLSGAGTALSVTNTASIGTLAVTVNATVGGTLDVTGAISTDSSLTYGTEIVSSCEGLTNYVWVPGNPKFGTMPGFCVMQYEAKNDGSDNAISQADTTPWASISQRDARTKAREACDGCHLITDYEWMTIAENLAFVDANWSGGSVGSGCLFRGNNGTDDACGYNGSDPEYGTGRNTKARLTLSTGEYIWDISGNVYEWTDYYTMANRGPVDGSPASEWLEYTAIVDYGAYEYAKPSVDTWSTTQGIGRVYTDYASGVAIRGIARGSSWNGSTGAGVFTIALGNAPSATINYLGFRVAR